MNDKDRDAFLSYVETYIYSDPEAAPLVAGFVQKGLTKSLDEVKARASEMEAALLALACQRFRNRDEYVKQVVGRWSGHSSFEWDWLLKPEED